jgi:hypothetical protein
MATSTTTTVINQTTDAGFQTWIQEIITQLAAVGLTQTSDTGQINPSTVTRPGSGSTSAGYTIWRFDDTLQSTKPIFIKIEFGTSLGTNYPQLWVQTSTGTNGAGTLNATGLTGKQTVCTYFSANGLTSYPSYFCYNATLGFFGMAWKVGVNGSGWTGGSIFVGRSNDSSGNSTGDAMFLVSGDIGGAACGSMQCYSWLNNTVFTASNVYNYYPFALSSTTNTAGSYQVFPSFMRTPNIQFTQLIGTCVTSEVPWGNSFTSALIGSTPRTYLNVVGPSSTNVTLYNSGTTNSVNTNTLSVFMLWQ